MLPTSAAPPARPSPHPRGESAPSEPRYDGALRPPSVAAARPFVRAVAWNVRGGADIEGLLAALRDDVRLARADLVFLCEVDRGTERSGGRSVAAELARELGMAWVFLPTHRRGGGEEGLAILSRFPLDDVRDVEVPERRAVDGAQRALAADVLHPRGRLQALALHLDPAASPAHRAGQISRALPLVRSDAPVLVAGAFNTHTFDGSSWASWAWSGLSHRIGRSASAFRDALALPASREPLFEVLCEEGFSADGLNELERPTWRVGRELDDPEQRAWMASVPRPIRALVEARLGSVGALGFHLDWFVGRGVTPVRARVAEVGAGSDHAPIVADLRWW